MGALRLPSPRSSCHPPERGGDSSGKATAPEVVVPKVAGGQGHQVNPSAPSPAPVPIAGLNTIQKLV